MYTFLKENFKKVDINKSPANFIYKGLNIDKVNNKYNSNAFIKNGNITQVMNEKHENILTYGFNIKQDTEIYGNENKNYSLAQKLIRDSRAKKLDEFTIDLTDININLEDFIYSLYSNQYVFTNKMENNVIYPKINILTNENVNNMDFIYEMSKQKNLAKEMLNFRPNHEDSYYLMNLAKNIANSNPNVELEIIMDDDLLKNNLNLIHCVGRGSTTMRPHLIVLKYNYNDSDYESLVGKGVVYDTGGYNIKPTGAMFEMFTDKGGAVSIIHAFEGLVNLGLKRNLMIALPVVENSVSSNSYKPCDIYTSHKGLTVEITNTDAEGRLILADAMSYIQSKYKIKSLVELSTLTGACEMALGEEYCGLFSNSKNLEENLRKHGNKYGDYLWPLPLTKGNVETMKGKNSDLINAFKGPMGASTAAAFLKNFVYKGVEWAHIDIAGPSYIYKPSEINEIGTTGVLVGLLMSMYSENN